MDSQLRIIVTGLIAQHPQMGGVAWDYVQYAAGLRRLGHDVYYFEDSGEWPYHLDQTQATDDWIVRDPRRNLDHLHGVLDRFGLGERWAYRFPYNNSWYGLSDLDRRRILDSADLVINVSGTIEHPDTYRRAGRLAYIDSDPLFTQVKVLLHWKQGHMMHTTSISASERTRLQVFLIPVTTGFPHATRCCWRSGLPVCPAGTHSLP
jgi:hypothetical protein